MSDIKSCKVHWFYGKTGTGKTKEVKRILHDKVIKRENIIDEIFIENISSRWCWDIYAKWAKFAVFDNVYDEDNDYVKLKDITLFINDTPKDIYITSLYRPEEIYEKYRDAGDEEYKNLINHIVELREFKI